MRISWFSAPQVSQLLQTSSALKSHPAGSSGKEYTLLVRRSIFFAYTMRDFLSRRFSVSAQSLKKRLWCEGFGSQMPRWQLD